MASHSGNSDDRLSKGIAVSGLERYSFPSTTVYFFPATGPPALLLLVSSGVVVPALCLATTVPVAPLIYEPFIHLSFRRRRTPGGLCSGVPVPAFHLHLVNFLSALFGIVPELQSFNRSPSESASDEPVREQFPACYSLISIYRLLFSLHTALFIT